jgi:hypothetical protein
VSLAKLNKISKHILTHSQTPVSQCNPSTFTQNVTFTGIWAATSGWAFKIFPAPNASSCCGLCYNTTGVLTNGTSCNAWQWDSSNDASMACTVLINFAGGYKNDASCPSGYTDLSFAKGAGGKYVAGSGPCGGAVHINGNAVAITASV